jgi:anti-sigma regulatory factor (Ser/Thr protein kinase)
MAEILGRARRDLDAPARAREAVRSSLGGRVPKATLDDALLVVTELVLNAVLHGQGAVECTTELAGGEVRGEVIDQGSGFVHEVRERGPEAVGGLGLRIVGNLTTSWGVREGTTHVWFAIGVGDAGGT